MTGRQEVIDAVQDAVPGLVPPLLLWAAAELVIAFALQSREHYSDLGAAVHDRDLAREYIECTRLDARPWSPEPSRDARLKVLDQPTDLLRIPWLFAATGSLACGLLAGASVTLFGWSLSTLPGIGPLTLDLGVAVGGGWLCLLMSALTWREFARSFVHAPASGPGGAGPARALAGAVLALVALSSGTFWCGFIVAAHSLSHAAEMVRRLAPSAVWLFAATALPVACSLALAALGSRGGNIRSGGVPGVSLVARSRVCRLALFALGGLAAAVGYRAALGTWIGWFWLLDTCPLWVWFLALVAVLLVRVAGLLRRMAPTRSAD